MSDFYKYFKENMEDLGLTSPPASLYGTQALAISTISAILAYIDKFGQKSLSWSWQAQVLNWSD